MSIKYILLVSLLIFISTKNEFLSLSELRNGMSFLGMGSNMEVFAGNESDSKESTDSKFVNIKCLFSKGYNIYSLQSLQNKDKDYNVTDKDGKSILFNFCRNTHVVENSTFVKKDGNNYIRLSGSIDGEGEDNKNIWAENDKEKGGVTISFVEGDKCSETDHHLVKLKVNCNGDVDGEDFLNHFTITNNDSCLHFIEIDSLYGCSLRSSYLLLKLFKEYKFIFAIIFIVVGLILCFFGLSFSGKTVIIICGLLGCYLITAVILNLFPNLIKDELSLLICLLVCLVLGCVVGFFLRGEIKFTILLCGGFLGYCVSIFVYQIVQNYVNFDPQILYYAVVGICIVLGAALGWYLANPIIILGTAVFGGYLAMRGISLIAGNYLDEGYIIDLIKDKEWDQLKDIRDGWTYAYLGAWLVLAVAGIIVQCKNAKKSKSSDYSSMK